VLRAVQPKPGAMLATNANVEGAAHA